jgi:glycosyltransferase involved in cell wall biosynthesis
VLHLREGAPDIPVWVFCTTQPAPETLDLCERVWVRPSTVALLIDAQRQSWPRWVALTIAPWTGDRSGWALKIAPFLIPPGRALLLNENGDFFHGSPGAIAQHLRRRSRDAGATAWHGAQEFSHKAADRLRHAAHISKLLALNALGTVLLWIVRPGWFQKLHGQEAVRVEMEGEAAESGCVTVRSEGGPHWDHAALAGAAATSDARWILWGTGEATPGMFELFDDPRTFAVGRQLNFRAWKPGFVPTAPFRTLQRGEFSEVLAPVSDTILVDRQKLHSLGVPATYLPETAWMLLFWQAAAAGWRSCSAGAGAGTELREQPDAPMQDAAFLLHIIKNKTLRRLGPRRPELSRGAVAFHSSEPYPSRGEKPRVLLVSPFLPYPLSHGGAVRIWNLCRALAPRVEFILAALREKDDVIDYARLGEVFREVHIVDIDQRASKDASVPSQVRHHESRVMRALIAELARKWQPELLQIEYTHMAHFRDAAPHVPAILVEHDLTFSLYGQLAATRPGAEAEDEYRRWRAFELRWLKAYDGVWTVSEEDRQIAARESGRPLQRTYNVPNGVDIDRFQPSPDAGAREIFYVGSFRHLPNMIGFEKLEREVMPRVWEQFPDARLRVVAGPRHEHFWSARPLDRRIDLRGFVEDLRPFYASASVVVVPLEVSAGTNIKVLEALACGKPVVTTPVGCAGLDLEDGGDALIRADWEAFAGAICELLAASDLRERMSARARATAETRFGWQSIADRAFESYCAVNVATATFPGSVCTASSVLPPSTRMPRHEPPKFNCTKQSESTS